MYSFNTYFKYFYFGKSYKNYTFYYLLCSLRFSSSGTPMTHMLKHLCLSSILMGFSQILFPLFLLLFLFFFKISHYYSIFIKVSFAVFIYSFASSSLVINFFFFYSNSFLSSVTWFLNFSISFSYCSFVSFIIALLSINLFWDSYSFKSLYYF